MAGRVDLSPAPLAFLVGGMAAAHAPAFAPLAAPVTVVAMVGEQAGHGATVAPVAREIVAAYFDLSGGDR